MHNPGLKTIFTYDFDHKEGGYTLISGRNRLKNGSKSASRTQANLFYGSLINMLDTNDPLIALADAIDWRRIEKELEKYYDHSNGNLGKPIRLMAGLLMLKQLENLSDENVTV